LKKADWTQSSIITGDVVAEAIKPKQQDGNDLVIYGHGLLGRTLLASHLLDELKLWIHPLLVGQGQLLFLEGEKARLKLLATRTLRTGVLVVSYQAAQY
jgi:dihydrofolate reductase